MLLFALGLHPLIKELEERFPDLDINAWLADDGTLVGNPHRVAEALDFLIERGRHYGFTINTTKTKAWCTRTAVMRPRLQPRPETNIPPLSCQLVNKEAVEILGAPIGSTAGCQQLAVKRIAKTETLWENLTAMADPQCSYHLLRVCASTCRLLYFLRCTPPHITTPICRMFDKGMRRVFEESHGTVTDDMWKIVSLPLREGGLGIASSSHILESCYVSSVLTTATHVSSLLRYISFSLMQHIEQPLNTLRGKVELSDEFSAAYMIQKAHQGQTKMVQQALTDTIQGALTASVMAQISGNDPVSKRKRLRIQSCSTPNATKPFASLPTGDTWIQPETWKTMVGIRIGKQFFTGSQICPTCAEGQYRSPHNLDPDGHHASVCPGRTGSVRRHNALRDMLIRELSKPPVCLYPKSEWVFPCDRDRPANSRRRLDFFIDSILFAPSPHGFDVTIISPHSAPHSRNAKCTPTSILNQVEKAKEKKYEVPCHTDGVTLYPMGADIYGSLGKNAEQAIWKMAEAIALRRGSNPKTEDTRLRLKISLLILRSVALAINRRNLGTLQNLPTAGQ